MNLYTSVEQADMHLILGECHGRAHAAVQLYGERYPHRRLPDRGVFERVDRNLRDWGAFTMPRHDRGRPPHIRVAQAEAILDVVADNPSISTRRLGLQVGVGRMSA